MEILRLPIDRLTVYRWPEYYWCMLATDEWVKGPASSAKTTWEFGRNWPDDPCSIPPGRTRKEWASLVLPVLPAVLFLAAFVGLIIFGIVSSAGAAGGCGGG